MRKHGAILIIRKWFVTCFKKCDPVLKTIWGRDKEIWNPGPIRPSLRQSGKYKGADALPFSQSRGFGKMKVPSLATPNRVVSLRGNFS